MRPAEAASQRPSARAPPMAKGCPSGPPPSLRRPRGTEVPGPEVVVDDRAGRRSGEGAGGCGWCRRRLRRGGDGEGKVHALGCGRVRDDDDDGSRLVSAQNAEKNFGDVVLVLASIHSRNYQCELASRLDLGLPQNTRSPAPWRLPGSRSTVHFAHGMPPPSMSSS